MSNQAEFYEADSFPSQLTDLNALLHDDKSVRSFRNYGSEALIEGQVWMMRSVGGDRIALAYASEPTLAVNLDRFLANEVTQGQAPQIHLESVQSITTALEYEVLQQQAANHFASEVMDTEISELLADQASDDTDDFALDLTSKQTPLYAEKFTCNSPNVMPEELKPLDIATPTDTPVLTPAPSRRPYTRRPKPELEQVLENVIDFNQYRPIFWTPLIIPPGVKLSEIRKGYYVNESAGGQPTPVPKRPGVTDIDEQYNMTARLIELSGADGCTLFDVFVAEPTWRCKFIGLRYNEVEKKMRGWVKTYNMENQKKNMNLPLRKLNFIYKKERQDYIFTFKIVTSVPLSVVH